MGPGRAGPASTERRHHVVVVGAGFGGLAAARELAGAPVDVTVVDARNHHTFQPLLYQVATAGLDGDDICSPVRGLFAEQPNARVRLGEVTGVDLAARSLSLSDGTELGYDDLVVAAGAVTNTFGIPGVEDHAFGLKSLGDALALRAHVLGCFERADADPAHLGDGTLTTVVAGGGPTGVELAGGLLELGTRVLSRDFPGLDLRPSRVVVVEAGDRLLAGFHARLGEKARATLERRGVEVLLDTAVTEVRPGEVVLRRGPDGELRTVPTRTMVWTAGVRAHPLAEALGVELTAGGRVVVRDDLSVPGHPEVYVVGDMAAARGPDGEVLPQVAPVAVQAARTAARSILSRRRGGPSWRFRYVDRGSMATIGRHDAVAQLPGGVRLSGPVGWVAWLTLHLVMLIGFRNRANVLVNWAWNYLTWDRASRIVPDDPAMPADRDGPGHGPGHGPGRGPGDTTGGDGPQEGTPGSA